MIKPGLGRKFIAMICASALVLAGAVDFAQACTRFIYADGDQRLSRRLCIPVIGLDQIKRVGDEAGVDSCPSTLAIFVERGR